MTYCLFVIGCQQNKYDASRLAAFLNSQGFSEVDEKFADIVFVLACSVRQTAVDKIFGKIHNWRKAGKKVFVTACILDNDKQKLEKLNVSYFVDFNDLYTLLVYCKTNNVYKVHSGTMYVPIMSGCDNFCSYCVVPYTRGREKSRSYDDVILDIKQLIKSGHKEFVLLGQNVNSYAVSEKRKAKSEKQMKDFVVLLGMINNIPGDFVFSFMSNHPKDMSDDIIHAIARLPKVKKEIHLPLQSGSDRILKLMNRPYTTRQYFRLIEKCKSKIENLSVTTDIIVGFPGETDEDFQQTVDIVKKVGFGQIFINKYSPRPSTASYKLGDPIPWSLKQKRWHILNEIANLN